VDLRTLPWGKIALGAAALMLMATPTQFPDRWAKARQLHPQAQPKFLALLLAIEKLGYRVEITSAYRAGGTDAHAYGLALDINLVHVRTGQRYGMNVGFTTKAQWEATGVPALIRAWGYRWGGDFVTPWLYKGVLHPGYDPVHIDLFSKWAPKSLSAAAVALAASTGIKLADLDRRQVRLAA